MSTEMVLGLTAKPAPTTVDEIWLWSAHAVGCVGDYASKQVASDGWNKLITTLGQANWLAHEELAASLPASDVVTNYVTRIREAILLYAEVPDVEKVTSAIASEDEGE